MKVLLMIWSHDRQINSSKVNQVQIENLFFFQGLKITIRGFVIAPVMCIFIKINYAKAFKLNCCLTLYWHCSILNNFSFRNSTTNSFLKMFKVYLFVFAQMQVDFLIWNKQFSCLWMLLWFFHVLFADAVVCCRTM